jgi:hypothetical protein
MVSAPFNNTSQKYPNELWAVTTEWTELLFTINRLHIQTTTKHLSNALVIEPWHISQFIPTSFCFLNKCCNLIPFYIPLLFSSSPTTYFLFTYLITPFLPSLISHTNFYHTLGTNNEPTKHLQHLNAFPSITRRHLKHIKDN